MSPLLDKSTIVSILNIAVSNYIPYTVTMNEVPLENMDILKDHLIM